MAVKYHRDTDPAEHARTVRLGMTPYRRQAREKGGNQRYRMALLYIAVFAVLLLTFASAISERNRQRERAPQIGVGRIIALEAPPEPGQRDAMGMMEIAFPADAADPAQASWAVPVDLWQALVVGDRVAIRYEGGRDGSYRLLDAGYVALPRDDAID